MKSIRAVGAMAGSRNHEWSNTMAGALVLAFVLAIFAIELAFGLWMGR
jgi:hypothetical protein